MDDNNTILPNTGNDNQYNSLYGQTPHGWSQLPPELLQNIFWILTTTNNSSMLTCRLVHPHWKSSADKILEEKCLQIWTKWTPSSTHTADDWTHTFPNLQLINTPYTTTLQYALCPPNLLTGIQNHSFSIPTSSLSIHFVRDRVLSEDYKVTQVVNLFEKVGSNLTSIEFTHVTVSISVLRSIFKNLTKVKAMTINLICLKPGHSIDGKISWNHPLPTQPNLTHYKIMTIVDLYHPPNSAFKWLLKSFMSQLVSLETNNDFFNNLEYPHYYQLPDRYPHLKQLKILDIRKHHPGRISIPLFPKLERVSLTLVIEMESIFEKLLSVFKFLATSANSLNHIHLKFQDWNRQKIDHHLLPKQIAIIFPKLVNLEIFTPLVEGEKEVLQLFLNVCPNLQTLKLLRDKKYSMPIHPKFKRTDLDSQTLPYKTICPKLTKLIMDPEVDDDDDGTHRSSNTNE